MYRKVQRQIGFKWKLGKKIIISVIKLKEQIWIYTDKWKNIQKEFQRKVQSKSLYKNHEGNRSDASTPVNIKVLLRL